MKGVDSAFSGYAPTYDAHFTSSGIGKLQRARVWKFLSRIKSSDFPEVLEIGCGTGEDAKWFAKKGFTVTATDFSEGMIKVAENKLKNIPGIKELCVCDAKNCVQQFDGRKFDLIFSDFGALNCLSPDEFRKLASELHLLLKPNGKIILVIMSRRCRWERSYFRYIGEKEKANRRRNKDGVETIIDGIEFRTWYYSPAEIIEMFTARFRRCKLRPVGLFIPPSYLSSYFEKRKGRLRFLDFLEKLSSFSLFADFADHYYIEMKFTGE